MSIHLDQYGYPTWSTSSFLIGNKTVSLELIHKLIKEYINIHSLGEGHNIRYHAKRYLMTLYYIEKYKIKTGTIFEAGGKSVFTYLIENILPDVNMIHSCSNLQDNIHVSNGAISSILCMEVLEHISDGKINHHFEFQGVFQMLKSFHDALKDDGLLLLTTPNIIGCYSFEKLLNKRNPMLYYKHVREYSPSEIKLILKHAGFDVLELKTENVFLDKDYKYTLRFLDKSGFSTEDRGEDIIVIAKKSNSSIDTSTFAKELFNL